MLGSVNTRPPLDRLIATAAVCLTASACGSASASKSDVIARGNAICAGAVRAVRAVAPPTGTSGPALAGYFSRIAPIVAAEVSQLRKLPRPDADKTLLNRYIAAESSAGGIYRQLVLAAGRSDSSAVARYLGALRASPAQTLARQYGMIQCAAAAGTATR